MSDFAAIIIPADTSTPIQFTRLPGTLEAARGAVGGDIESVSSPAGSAAYCNDLGKFENLTPNVRATRFLASVARHNSRDLIAGDVLIVGVDDEGETVDVPEAVSDSARTI